MFQIECNKGEFFAWERELFIVFIERLVLRRSCALLLLPIQYIPNTRPIFRRVREIAETGC